MKTQNSKNSRVRILCFLICIATTFYAYNFCVLATEPENSTVIPKDKVKKPESISLPQVEGPLYLEYALPKTHFYIGERIPITITLYSSDDLGNITVDNPTLNQSEFICDQLGNPSIKKYIINGLNYQTIKFSYLLTPLKNGAFLLGPIKQNCYLTIAGSTKKRTVEVTSQRIPVKVSELPNKGRPNSFSGAVGNFQIAIATNSRQILQGEPLTIRMTLSGYGNLQAVSAPLFQDSTGIKAYNAVKRTDLSISDSSWGKITFEQIIIPLDTKLKQIGPYTFSFFNLNTGRYQELSSQTLPITVKPNSHFQENIVKVNQTSGLKLASIKKDLGKLQLKDWQLIKQPWFWLWQLLPLLLLTGAVFYRRYIEMIQSDSPRARAIRSSNIAKQQLAAAQSISTEGRYDDLLDQLHLILREYLGERFNLPVAGMTGSVVKALTDKGLPPNALTNIQRFFEQYDIHRFAKSNFSQEEALKLWDEINQIISVLDGTNNKLSISKPEVVGKERQS